MPGSSSCFSGGHWSLHNHMIKRRVKASVKYIHLINSGVKSGIPVDSSCSWTSQIFWGQNIVQVQTLPSTSLLPSQIPCFTFGFGSKWFLFNQITDSESSDLKKINTWNLWGSNMSDFGVQTQNYDLPSLFCEIFFEIFRIFDAQITLVTLNTPTICRFKNDSYLAGWFQIFLCFSPPILGEMIQFEGAYVSNGWQKKHQPVKKKHLP